MTGMLDDVLELEFALIAIDQKAADQLKSFPGSDVMRPQIRKLVLYIEDPIPDHDGINAALVSGDDFGLSAHRGSVIFLRPDRFVAGAWQLTELADNEDGIASLLP